MQTINIKVIDNFSVEDAVLILDDNRLTFRYKDICLTEENVMPFGAMRAIRKKLDPQNILLLVNGSRKNVYPSGLIAHSNNAYVHELGKPSSNNRMVDIFAPVDASEEVCTVKEQEEFLKQWGNSLGG